jgi:hypothetical protein
MCSAKSRNKARYFYYIGLDTNFEIIRKELTFFFKKKRHKTLAETRKKKNQEMTQTKD